MRNIETASVVTSYETNYQTAQSLRRKLDRAMTTLVRIRAERDHIKQEYKLIMAERDNVHKDIEQLQEQVQDLFSNLQVAEQKSSNLEQQLLQVQKVQPRSKTSDVDLHKHLMEISNLKAQLRQTEIERDHAIQAAFNRSASTSPTQSNSHQHISTMSSPNHNANNNNNSSCNSENQLIIKSSEGDISGLDQLIPLKPELVSPPSKVQSIWQYVFCCWFNE